MNSQESTLNKLNKAYTECVNTRVQQYLDKPGTQGTEEFCIAEKKAFYDFLKVNFRHEFNNIVRIEEGTY